jgi:hypothetical protein
MLAASVQDLDGLGIIVSEEAYWALHHKLGHCASFGVVLCAGLAALSPRRVLSFALYFALFHLHLVMDIFGSGAGWEIYYFWPFSGWGFKTDVGWAFYSWQNISAFALLLVWTVAIARYQRRTPLELLMPSLDRQLVGLLPMAGQAPAPAEHPRDEIRYTTDAGADAVDKL